MRLRNFSFPPFDPLTSSDLKEWRARVLEGVLRGIYVFWLIGLTGGIINVVAEYSSREDQTRFLLLLAGGTITTYMVMTALLTFVTFNRKLSFTIRAGLLLFILYLLGTVSMVLASFSGDGRIFLFAFVILSAIFFDLRFSLTAFAVTFLTIAVVGYLQVSGIIFVPVARQANAALSGSWVSGGIVLLVLSIAALISITYLLRAFEKSLENSRKLLDREQNLARNLRVLSDINQLIVREQDQAVLLTKACERLIAAHGFSNVWIGLLNSDGIDLDLAASAGEMVDPAVFPMRLDRGLSARSCVAQAIQSREYVYTETFQKADSCLICPRQKVCPQRSAIALPLLRDERRLGALVVEHDRTLDTFPQEDIHLLQELADDLAYAIEKLEADKSLKTHARYQLLLNEVTQTALETSGVETMAVEFIRKLEKVLGADGYYFAFWDEEAQMPERFIISDDFKDVFSKIGKVQPEENFFTKSVLKAGHVLVVENVMNSPYISPRIAAEFQVRSALGLPLIADGRNIGALILGYREAYSFSQDEVNLAEQAARQFALALSKAKLNDETRAKAAELELLYSSAKDIASSLMDPPALLASLARHMAQALSVTSTNITSFNIANDTMTVVAEYFSEEAKPGEKHSDLGREYPNQDYATILRSITDGEVLVMHADDADMTAVEREQFKTYEIQSMLFVPIMSHGRLLGTIELWESRRKRSFTRSEIQLAQAMAGHAAGIIENSTLFAQTRQQESELRALLAVSRAVSSSLQLSDVLRQASSTLARLMRVDFCSLSDYLPERNEIITIALFSADEDVSGKGDLGRVFSLDDYPATLRVLRLGQPLVTRLDDPSADPSEIRQLKHDDMFSSLLIPLRLRGKSLGLAELFTSDPNRVFKPEEVQFASALADQVAVAIDNARLYEKLEEREAYFRALFENSADGVAIINTDGIVRYLAPSEERLTGYKPEEILGQSAFQYIHPQDLPNVLQTFKEGVAIPGVVRTIEYRLQRKDGEWRYFEITGRNMLDDPHIAGIVVNYRDVTERKYAEEAIRDSEERYRTIFQSAGVPIWEDDYSVLMNAIDELKKQGVTDFKRYIEDHPEFLIEAEQMISITDANTAVLEMMEAQSKEELMGSLNAILKNNPTDIFARDIVALAEGKVSFDHESSLYTLRGNRRDVWVSFTMPKGSMGYNRVLVSTLDITERKQAERALQDSQSRLQGIVNTALNAIITVDEDQRIVLFNPFAEKTFACTAEYALGKPLDIFIPEKFRKYHHKNVEGFGKTNVSNRNHGRLDSLYGLRQNGEEFPMEAFISQHTIGEKKFYTVILRDITERKLAEEALKESEQRFRALAENIPSTVYTCRNDSNYSMLYLNDSVEALTGYPKEEFLGGGLSFYDLYHPDDLDKIPYVSGSQTINEESFHITYRIRHRSGEWRWVDEWGTGVLDVNGNVQYIEGVMIDITERKRDEEALHRRAEELQSLVVVSSALRSALNVSQIIPLVVRYAVEIVGGEFGTIYQLEEATGSLVSPGWFSVERGEDIKVTSEVSLRHVDGKGITGHVAKTGKIHITEDIHNDPLAFILPGEADILKEACSGISLPLLSREKVVGVLHVRLRKHHVFTETEVRLLTAIAEMAGSAIHRAGLHEKTLQQADELSQAYDKTLTGWARALELRDELTEGHTRRVTDLTMKLARSLNISETEIAHIRRGAILHDIGKMGIPDAILHKPGPLTAHEQRIMQMHPQYAHEMLSFIPFLRLALDIPYCHHEHWDGNGYPRGLKAEEIPLAARIFSVVDVWDALTSDRPYRSAWSKQKARDYLIEGSGKQFDPAIVEKFLTLIEI